MISDHVIRCPFFEIFIHLLLILFRTWKSHSHIPTVSAPPQSLTPPRTVSPVTQEIAGSTGETEVIPWRGTGKCDFNCYLAGGGGSEGCMKSSFYFFWLAEGGVSRSKVIPGVELMSPSFNIFLSSSSEDISSKSSSRLLATSSNLGRLSSNFSSDLLRRPRTVPWNSVSSSLKWPNLRSREWGVGVFSGV